MTNQSKFKITIDNERCKGCVLCLKFCPAGAIKISEKLNRKGWKYIEIVDETKCTGCGLCVMMCPDCAVEIKQN
ncbi:MAG: 4Fe-4S binding protein [Candidatus Omnitrophica bacterium]|nr:4Fe-4S binding protein [Candidatus Omnitrophota bacterium]